MSDTSSAARFIGKTACQREGKTRERGRGWQGVLMVHGKGGEVGCCASQVCSTRPRNSFRIVPEISAVPRQPRLISVVLQRLAGASILLSALGTFVCSKLMTTDRPPLPDIVLYPVRTTAAVTSQGRCSSCKQPVQSCFVASWQQSLARRRRSQRQRPPGVSVQPDIAQ